MASYLTYSELVRWSRDRKLLCKVVPHLGKYIGMLEGRGMPARA